MRNIASRSRSGEEGGTPSELSRVKDAPTELSRASLASQMASPTQVQLDILHPVIGCACFMWGASIPISELSFGLECSSPCKLLLKNIQSRGWQLA